MKMTEVLGIDIKEAVAAILVGKPVVSNTQTSEGEDYYLAKLKSPVIVHCSYDPAIEPFETDEVYVRASALAEEGWESTNPKKPQEGFWRKGWVVDFSKGQKIPIYQSETIKKWTRANRKQRSIQNTSEINAGIIEKMKAREEARKANGGK